MAARQAAAKRVAENKTAEWAASVEEGARDGDGVLAQLDRGVRMGIVRTARRLGGAMVVILLTAVVLNEVFTTVDVGSGPFSQIGTDLTTTGVAAMGLLVVGLIVVAANRIMGVFGSSGGM
jgi:hypothetical protein